MDSSKLGKLARGLSLPLVLAAAFASGNALAQEKLVLQVSDGDPGKWNLALNNARNVQADLGKDKVEIEIVAYGPGIGMLKIDSPVGPRIQEALASHVKVVACENTMKSQKLQTADMLPNIDYVPSGVVELLLRQKAGYAYIRP